MRHFLFASVSACLLLGAIQSSTAQTTGPRELAPRVFTPKAEEKKAETEEKKPQSLSGGISIQSLGDISSETIGTLNGENALPSTMWIGSDRAFINALLENLPAKPSLPALRNLQKRLLLSPATPPKGTGRSLLELRSEKLMDMGEFAHATDLVQSIPQDARTASLKEIEVESLLLKGETAKACAVIAGEFQNNQDAFWVKSIAFCKMLAQQGDQAMLSLSLLQEMGDNDPVFYDLMEKLHSKERGDYDSSSLPSALNIALIKASDAKLGERVKSSANPYLLDLLYSSRSTSKEEKAVALQKAVAHDFVDAKQLSDALLALKFDKEAFADPITTAENLDPISAQALLYQVSMQENQVAALKTETIGVAFDLIKTQDELFSISKLYQPVIAELTRSIDMLWFAPKAVRALLSAGDYENAKHWYIMIKNAAFTDQTAAKAWTELRPLAAFAGFDALSGSVRQGLLNWWKEQSETPQTFAKAARLLSISDGLGLDIPDDLWLNMLNGPQLQAGHLPKTGLWIKMNKAAFGGKVGEALLTALGGLGKFDPKDADVTYLRDVIINLRALGLTDEARNIAVQTVLSSDL